MPAYRVFLRLGGGQRPEKVEELRIMKKLNELDVQELDVKEIRTVDGGLLGAGPLWWRPMFRAGFLSRTLILPRESTIV